MAQIAGVEVPAKVRIVEVGPRDGLQNEPKRLPTHVKVRLIERLADAGLQTIEVAAFVSPRRVPQMADGAGVVAGHRRREGVSYPVLTPNLKGFERAVAAGATDVAVFGAASETFSLKNIDCTVARSLARFERVTAAARERGIRVRGYVSCVAGCPYEGAVDPRAVAAVAQALFDMGCYEISLGDTIGVGTPAQILRMIEAVAARVPVSCLAGHFHDTFGRALANACAALQAGIAVLDSSVAGLGGCPYAPGASGNVATEDLLDLLQGLGIETGVDLDAVAAAGRYICGQLGRPARSRVAHALQKNHPRG